MRLLEILYCVQVELTLHFGTKNKKMHTCESNTSTSELSDGVIAAGKVVRMARLDWGKVNYRGGKQI
jgi:hypothetical protein